MISTNKSKLNDWLKDENLCKKDFEEFIKRNIIRKEIETKHLRASHLSKMEYNLTFVQDLLDNKKFYDWIIVGCYYTIYRAALALLAVKGYSSKRHESTLCALTNLWHHSVRKNDENLSEEDIQLIAESSLEKEEVSYFAEAKNKRETASYGIGEEFTKHEAEELHKQTIVFVNKVRKIMEKI
ncbi:MAG: HEPN domain-containing protein [Nanoarchaeota archaeon]|nr:HEPN domain-containing protein [Nanoarchaeota archaeon]